ncbi:RimJ/RimL family protein N-acetyltransferase [Actinomadura pelletieri DSM 43383]|uniref:RimJ/RimL family protein N-acetyltransferase n=1 Tax=Actinomadura pelletieri DSM 43383 TaxID=1120940 RepID=A0A495QYT6_9ACTN|nr:GNAT family N-acetyltransferase [Actinomadura pelletieri]RKS79086.1 RimJ/RimL family protein N-acetyltransferase [Actinomadura pelletieri DSM 43383]
MSSQHIPDLTTERLALRPWTMAEVKAVLDGDRQAHWADDFPAEGDRVIAGFIAEQHRTALGEYGQRQIVERATGLVVGSVGLFWPPVDATVEFGYGVVASRRGRGYATEASRALVAHALTAPGVTSVVAKVELSNPASVRVLENAGLRRLHGDAETATFGTS